MQVPEMIAPFLSQGKKFLQRKKIGEFHFSRGIYQIEVKDKDAYWPFLQFDEKGKYLDSFCTCQESEEKKGCPHLAAAFLKIFSGHQEPIHVRFRRSFWFHLLESAARRMSYEVSNIQKGKEQFYALSASLEKVFLAQGKTLSAKKRLQELFLSKKPETEETSLKFSSLAREELALYRKGVASAELRFELSFWSDLAKWLMLLQENQKKYQILFLTKDKNQLPSEVRIEFTEIRLHFQLKEEMYPDFIPSLKTVKSSLTVFDPEENLVSLTFSAENSCFYIHTRVKEERKEQGKQVGDWIYIPKKGFYPKSDHPWFQKKILPKEEIAANLSQYTSWFETYLVGTSFDKIEKPVKYHLSWGEEEALHVEAYIEKPGDLSLAQVQFFFPWVYSPEKGFFRLGPLLFSSLHIRVEKNHLPEFLVKHRSFLQNYEGFTVHTQMLESFIDYTLTPDKELVFSHRLTKNKGDYKDLDSWIYLPGEGFFQKDRKEGTVALFLKNQKIKAEEIAAFIQEKKDILAWIPHFFSNTSPVKKVGVQISLDESNQILVTPHIEYEKGYSSENVLWFGCYSFVSGEGFFDISSKGKLPAGYQKKRKISPKEEPFFMEYELERLRPFLLDLDTRLQKPKELHLQIASLQIERKQKKVFLVGELFFLSELGEINLFNIWEGLLKGKKYLFSKAGSIWLDQPRFLWLKSIKKKRWEENLLQLTYIEWIRLSIWENIQPPLGQSKEEQEIRKVLAELDTLKTIVDISHLRSVLRPYQERGLQWLWHLYSYGLSGILCDEMGLGKTHQAMALLAASMAEDRSYKYLVVCPTSVIYHWQNLLQKFLPDLRVLVYHGIDRSMEGFSERYDVLVTSYGIIRTGKQNLKEIPFEIAIFDEIQFAKNIRSQTHQHLRGIEANMKLALTGTPIENRLEELKAIFDLILPGYLPSNALFRQVFSIPIEKYKEEEKKKLLMDLIQPFILRRKKAEVLLDLPEKIEEIIYCDLSEEQQRIYENLMEERASPVLQNLADSQQNIAYAPIFSLLTQLKQLCDHPCVLQKDSIHFMNHSSGKWEAFQELLEESLDAGRKVVIFSQYLEMIEIFKLYLEKKQIGFACLTGSTKDRKEQIQKFHQEPECRVFVASLLAAGVGIDLSCASIVIHYDRWWNAAKEEQATDRVHRIGQSRGVQVFKLVTKNTIEEKIHALIEKKKDLMEETLGKDEADQIRLFNREELQEIFRKTGKSH